MSSVVLVSMCKYSIHMIDLRPSAVFFSGRRLQLSRNGSEVERRIKHGRGKRKGNKSSQMYYGSFRPNVNSCLDA